MSAFPSGCFAEQMSRYDRKRRARHHDPGRVCNSRKASGSSVIFVPVCFPKFTMKLLSHTFAFSKAADGTREVGCPATECTIRRGTKHGNGATQLIREQVELVQAAQITQRFRNGARHVVLAKREICHPRSQAEFAWDFPRI